MRNINLQRKMNMRTVFSIIMTVMIFLPVQDIYAQSGREKVKKANEFYNSQQFEEALNMYRDAELDNPESAEIKYNIGNTLYMQGKYDEAFGEFNKVLTAENPDLHFRSYYNMGNTLYRMEKLPESILSYTQALRVNPDDIDSKYNLEYVRNELKEKSENPNDGNSQEDQEQQQQEQQQQNKRDQQEQEEEQEQQEGEQENPATEEPQKQDQQETEEISREEAERILNALENDEKDLLEQRNSGSKSTIRVKKNW